LQVRYLLRLSEKMCIDIDRFLFTLDNTCGFYSLEEKILGQN
jgi:hypothetical protein